MTETTNDTELTARGVLRHYWRVVDGRWWQLALPIGLILLAAGFEAASFSLLWPLTEAFGLNRFYEGRFIDESVAAGVAH